MIACHPLGIEWLTHWGRVTHICVSDLAIIGSDNGLSPGQRQAIIRTNADILLIRPLGTNSSEILIEILIFSLKKMRLKVSSAKRQPFCLGLHQYWPITNWNHSNNPLNWSSWSVTVWWTCARNIVFQHKIIFCVDVAHGVFSMCLAVLYLCII